MATFGRIDAFDSSTEQWSRYAERLNFYFVANSISDDDKKRAILLTVCGPVVYGVLRDLIAPSEPADMSFNDLVTKLQDHYDPKSNVIVERFKFQSCARNCEESVNSFVARLKHQAARCAFAGTLEERLRDQLVWGINMEQLQKRLLAVPNLTWGKALEICLAFETAERGALALQPTKDINKVTPHYQPGRAQRGPDSKTTSSQSQRCYRCGEAHRPDGCRFKDVVCHYCSKRGHIARWCRKKERDSQSLKPGQGGANAIMEKLDQQVSSAEEDIAYVLAVTEKAPSPMIIDLNINNSQTRFEVDTGASRTVMAERAFSRLRTHTPSLVLEPCNISLRSYTGQHISLKGATRVTVSYKGKSYRLSALVVAGQGANLLGRDWIKVLPLDWPVLLDGLFQVCDGPLAAVLENHKAVFQNELGELKGTKVTISVDESVPPRFCKARPVPLALQRKVEIELTRLVESGILQPVTYSEWAAPIVPVLKGDGSIRICGDYKLTVNTASRVEQYPLPRIDELFTKLAGGVCFSKLDMSHAYQQLVLAEDSRKLVTINTHRGLFQYTRLPFGVSSACAIFQRAMEGLLAGIDHVVVYLDDILLTGVSEDQHLRTLDLVLSRLEEAGLRLKRSKCVFMAPEVEYLGHKISSKGLQPLEKKVQAIKDAPRPQNISELRAYLGMLNYYGRFLPDLASVLAPLHALLRAGVKWEWNAAHDNAFNKSKALLTSEALLVHYDPTLPLVIAADASPFGLGAVLSHKYKDGAERPVCFASRALAPAERKYAQVEKEALAVIFAVKKFHQFVYGHKFTIQTDHKPLLGLLGELKNIQPTASARLQRWALLLMQYQYTLAYKPGALIAHADGLSRLPLPYTAPDPTTPPELVCLMQQLQTAPITSGQLKDWTRRDPLLARVCLYVTRGWPLTCPASDFLPYFKRRDELTVEDGVLLWGLRVIIPPRGRKVLMEELHEAHPGVSRMKAVARAYMWWPGLDTALEDLVKSCTACQQIRNAPPAAPVCPWEWPGKPWTRLHVDYAGPFLGEMFLVLVDSHSKWLEVFPVKSATSTATVDHLRDVFSAHGLPHTVVSDNASIFTSSEFEGFLKLNGVRHLTSAPYHPSSNGLVERAVQTLKKSLKKMTGGTLRARLARFLAAYRFTPHATTGLSPAEMLFGRRVRTRWDLLRPDAQAKVLRGQEMMVANSKRHAVGREMPLRAAVWVRDFSGREKWLPGTVIDKTGPLSYRVEVAGNVWRRHVDHLLCRNTSPRAGQDWEPGVEQQSSDQPDSLAPADSTGEQPDAEDVPGLQSTEPDDAEPDVVPWRSSRVRKRPSRLDL
ncbi:hypothetical protein ACEWY4_007939 [Coilia grayii]|uniref:Gypsy retrotransposon integrase-like protein 1 n=1 Tax=Coilia grayii TaxID=363190 RepID=A0ABD1K9S7_9TELE